MSTGALIIAIISALITVLVWLAVMGVYVALRRGVARRQLLTLRLRACARLQMPLSRALTQPDGAPREVARIMRDAGDRMEDGQSLSEALDGHWACIPPWYTRLLAIGEENGNLAEVLDLLLETDERAEDKRIGVFNQLLYPFFLLLVINSVLQTIFLYVVPKFTRMFGDMGVTATPLQSTLLGVGRYFMEGAPVVLLILGVAMGSLIPFPWGGRWEGSFAPIRWLTWFWRRLIPPLGRAHLRAASARWAGAVSLMLEAGMPLSEAADRAADIETSSKFRSAARRWADDLAAGRALSTALSRDRFVPRSLIWQVRCAEGGSELPEVLREAGERETVRLQQQVGNVIRALTPFFVMAIAVVVAGVAFGLFRYLTGLMHALA